MRRKYALKACYLRTRRVSHLCMKRGHYISFWRRGVFSFACLHAARRLAFIYTFCAFHFSIFSSFRLLSFCVLCFLFPYFALLRFLFPFSTFPFPWFPFFLCLSVCLLPCILFLSVPLFPLPSFLLPSFVPLSLPTYLLLLLISYNIYNKYISIISIVCAHTRACVHVGTRHKKRAAKSRSSRYP